MTETPMSMMGPLERGWSRMVGMLFRRGSARTWFVVGFSAWLAGLTGEGGYHVGGSTDRGGYDYGEDWGDWVSGDAFYSNETLAGMVFAGCLIVLAVALVLLWVSSRGKFVFLDNVVHQRAEIVAPWKRFSRQGNSLFFFRLIAFLVCVPIALGLIGLCIWLAGGPDGWAHLEGAGVFAGVAATALLACLAITVLLYVLFFLDAFVVPLMHRHDLTAMQAWKRFGGRFRQRPGWFVLCGLVVFVLCMVVAAAVTTLGVMTCCLGFLLLAIPYVSTLVLLPVLIAYRAFTVEFLAQLEPELLDSDAPVEA